MDIILETVWLVTHQQFVCIVWIFDWLQWLWNVELWKFKQLYRFDWNIAHAAATVYC